MKIKLSFTKIKDFFKKSKFQKNLKKGIRKHKKVLWASSVLVGALVFSLTIYFSQTLGFYQMALVEKQPDNNVNTLYSHDSYITKRYKRTIPQTYSGDVYYTEQDATNSNSVQKSLHFRSPTEYPSPEYPVTDINTLYDLYDENSVAISDVFINEQLKNNSLKKHPGIDYQYMYENRLPDDALAVEKYFNIDLTQPGYITTGLYLGPGEIINLNFPGLTDEQVKNLGLSLSLGDSDNRSPAKNESKLLRSTKRLAFLNKVVQIDKNNFSYGTPFGGIVHIVTTKNPSVIKEITDNMRNVGMVANGAVEALHYINGYTTQEEWFRLVNEAKAPIFDISADHIKFIGPKVALQMFEENNNPNDSKWYPYKAMDLFDKMALDSLYTINNNSSWKQPYRHSFSNYVAAGAAVSFVGASIITEPWSWARGFLDYDTIIQAGSWGIMHENNHQNQNSVWGYGGSTEVTNNVLTVASYLKFTNVLNNRQYFSTGLRTDHNGKLNGFVAQTQTDKVTIPTTERQGIDYDYTPIMSHFGTSKFQDAIRSYTISNATNHWNEVINVPQGISSASFPGKRNARFVYRISEITGYNWSEFAYNTNLILQNDKDVIDNAFNSREYQVDKFLPVSSFYASEINYNNSGYQYIQRPFLIEESFFKDGYLFDLKGKTITSLKRNMTSTYSLSDIEITEKPNYGSFEELLDTPGTWKYIPDTSDLNRQDSFEYKLTVSDSETGLSIPVIFKVAIQLQGNNVEFKVPSNYNYQQYYLSTQKSEKENVNYNTGNKENDEILELLKDPVKVKTTVNGNQNDSKSWKTENHDGQFYSSFKISFKEEVEINFLELRPYWTYQQCPDGIIIEDQSGNELYNGNFIQSEYATFTFAKVKTNSLTVKLTTFDQVAGATDSSGITSFSEQPVSKTIRLYYFDVGITAQPTQILTPNSNWIYQKGDWRTGNKDGKVNGTSLYTIFPEAKLQFAFSGTDFSIIGTKDKNYGSFEVYVDGKFSASVSSHSNSRQSNEPLHIEAGLKEGDHFVTILTKSSLPVEIQYLALTGEAKPIEVNDWYYFLTIGLPFILILAIALATISTLYYLKVKNKKIMIFDKSLRLKEIIPTE
ncbi:MAG: M60 family metallopeptidase, partial [Malacoplasma sp.]|nr:M60 family metallopeptidase [Malacoplasma sp.]